MSKRLFAGISAKHGNETHSIEKIMVLFFEEDSTFFAYAPSLDLIGYGDTEEESAESFRIVLEEYLKYTINKGTTIADLRRLGWKITKSRDGIKALAPAFEQLVEKDESVKNARLIRMEVKPVRLFANA